MTRPKNQDPETYNAKRRAKYAQERDALNARRRERYAQRNPLDGPRAHVEAGLSIKGTSVLTGRDGAETGKWTKTHVASDEQMQEPLPPWFVVEKISRYTGPDGSVRGQHTTYSPDVVDRWRAFESAVQALAEPLRGAIEPKPRPKKPGHADLMNVIPFGDPHFGLLSWAPETGENHDLQIAQRDFCEGIDRLLAVAPRASVCTLVNLGDAAHAQDDKQVTPTAGHKLDVEGRHEKVFDALVRSFRHAIDRALECYETVHVRNVKGNHDPILTVGLAYVLRVAYEREPRVIVTPCSNPFQVAAWGRVLLGFAHSDGAPLIRLPGIMANDWPELWGAALYRHWITGHVHHKSIQTFKEHPGCSVETVQTLAARDYWSHWKGFRARRSVSAITYHAKYGETVRTTMPIERIREGSCST